MALNYAKKYAQQAVERFARGSVTQAVLTAKYDWTGAKTVVLTTNDLASLNDYNRSGVWRFGTPVEEGNTQQELTLSQDKSWTTTIDRRNRDDAGLTNAAGASLRRQIAQVIVPTVDTYRLGQIVTQAPAAHVNTSALAVNDVYQKFLALQELLGDDGVPESGRTAFCTYAAFNLLKQDSAFVKSGDLSQEMLVNGQLGEVDGVRVIPVPSGRMPANTAIILVHPDAVAAPLALESYRIHEDPPGIDGWLIEGRVVHDCFVVDTLENGIAVHKTA